MTVRQSILAAIKNDFLAITTGNGYLGTVKKIYQTFRDLSSIKESDLTAVHITPLPATSVPTESAQIWSWDIAFILYFGVNRDAGDDLLVETLAENYIEDITQKFLNPAYTVAVQEVESVNISLIDTYPQDELNTVGVVYGTITITYFN